MVSVVTTYPCHCSAKAARNKQVWLCPNKTLCVRKLYLQRRVAGQIWPVGHSLPMTGLEIRR